MKTLQKTTEEHIFETIRMKGVKVSYSDEMGNPVLTHTIIRSNPSVGVIVRKDNCIAFIRQFRSTTGKNYIEIPAGIINDGESEEAAAVREVCEETGLLVKNTYVLVKGPSLLDPSKSDENFGVAVADAYNKKTQSLDDMEQIDSEVIWMNEEEVFARIKAQMFLGEPFIDDIYMSGHSLYAIMAYMLSK